MNKTSSKSKGILKATAVGFAAILCGAFFPVNALASATENWANKSEVESSANRIQINGNLEENQSSFIVKKGSTFKIPAGQYYGKTGTAHLIGTTPSGTISTSAVKVTYSATGDKVLDFAGLSESELNNKSFVASRVGTYVITYSVVDNGILYSYDLAVTCEASSATFSFETNSENIIPSVYDVKLAQSKDIVLPLPTVTDENGETILSAQDEADADYYVLDKNGAGRPGEPDSKNCFVAISITNGSEDLEIEKDSTTGNFVIKGDTITSALDGKEFTINYSFYQLKESNSVFIGSTTRTFSVKDGHYYTNSDKTESGYDLTATLSSAPDTAVVGTAVSLPIVTAKTSASNSPASESVEVYYTIQIIKADSDGKYTTNDVTDAMLTEDGKFKATEEGSYKFVYTIKDFYGHEVATSKASFTIDNIKDTKSPEVYMYDAGDYTVDAETGAYSSAKTKMPTTTVNRNVILYAIAGVDNMTSNTVTLRREIRDGSTGVKRYIISEQAYNGYNLIFGAAKTDEASIYRQIVSDNYEIYKQMLVEKLEDNTIDPTDDESIKTWLKEHNYLIVTHEFNKDVDGNTIINEEGFSEESENAVAKLIEQGYAYVKPESSTYKFSSAKSYDFYYFASDNINNNKEKQIYQTIKLDSDYTDEAVPSITFPEQLQSAYLPNETIKFTVPTSSDVKDTSGDANLEIVTAYRYLKNGTSTRTDVQNGKVVVESEQTTDAITYLAKRTATKDQSKWFFTGRDVNGLMNSEGWNVVTDSTCKINLASKPDGAEYVEILTYAVDDYGNVGFFNKLIKIADAQDATAPSLYRVVGAPEETDVFTAPQTINLPVLYFSDDKADYMHADVVVYKLTGEGENTTKQVMHSSGMQTEVYSIDGKFVVDAGSFSASSEGKYQAAVTVTDSGKHTYTTYFNYTVGSNTIVEDPEIPNITAETKELAIDEGLYLPTPTISVSDSETYGYIGLGDDDDQNNATYYTTTVVSATSNNYELDKYYFIGKTKGTYKIQYNVFLIRYNRTDTYFAESATAGKLYVNENGQLAYLSQDGATTYHIYVEKDLESEEYKLHINTSRLGDGTELTAGADYERINSAVKFYALTKAGPTVSVQEVVISGLENVKEYYPQTSFATIDKENPKQITIVKPDITISGSDKGNTIDKQESTVKITYSANSTTTVTLANLTLEKWESLIESGDDDFTVDGTTIKLRLIKNGTYKIAYSIQAQDALGQNIGDPKTQTIEIKNGDTVAPKIKVDESMFAESYTLGDEIVINMSKVEVSDAVTTDVDKLLSTLNIVLTNKDSGKTWTLTDSDEGEGYSFEHTFDEVGEYTLIFTIKDEAGNSATAGPISFQVKAKGTSDPVDVKEVLGGVLIGVSVALLAGVVIYFVVSKVKLDKKEKAYKNAKRK